METSHFHLTLRWPVSASSPTNGDITDMMQHTETSTGMVPVSVSSRISSDERDDYSDKDTFKKCNNIKNSCLITQPEGEQDQNS